MIDHYFTLIKPGIIAGNLLTAFAGFALASQGEWRWKLLFVMMAGLSCVISSACVVNNYLDRDIDAKMKRTQKRIAALEALSSSHALFFAGLLAAVGISLLYSINALPALMAAIGFIVYVNFYTLLKRYTDHSTLIGSIAGSMPPLVGYTAVAHSLDIPALFLFIIIACWQMPHFFAIALYRLSDYKKADLPVFAYTKGSFATKRQALFYIAAFTVAAMLMTPLGYTGPFYFIAVSLCGILWFWYSWKTLLSNDQHWGRAVFLHSLIVITIFCSVIPLELFLQQ